MSSYPAAHERNKFMKFLHLADLHLGRSLNEISLIPDQKYLLHQILELSAQEKPDAVLIAGDVYDRAVPSEEAVALLDAFLSELAAMRLPVLLISGNHDSDERLNFGSRLLKESGIYICGKYDGTLRQVSLTDGYGSVHFWLLPYITRAQVQHFWPDEDTRTYESAVRTVLRHAEIDFTERNVLLAHQFVTPGKAGSGDPILAGSETAAQNVGTIDRISSDVFDHFDYVALGHIHRPQKVGRESIRYGGSPLRYSLSEVGQDKAYTLVEMANKGSHPAVTLIPVKPLHEMRLLKGHFEELMKPENIEYPDDYVFVTLTDRTPVPDAFAAIQAHYPNACGLRYELPESSKAARSEKGISPEGDSVPTFSDQIRAFYRQILGEEPTDEEMKILESAAREAGVED